ncbi:FAD-binding protein [Bacillus sp. FJAT-27225]|uniref:FAD-binding protein n=1 Tax=Bacillus sp. FJAT-27225 TaxID=1743144 RepID=UPI001111D4A5|nr:FAD-binding protein [Bacillus sp. FJAT-27225]
MIKEILTTDVLVVGSGIAGLKVSMELAKAGQDIIMSTKTQLCSGSSFFPLKASLGTQVTKNEEDKTVFLEDIEAVSHNMQDREMAKIYIEEIQDRVKEYPEIGIEPYKLSDDRKACFANNGRTIYMLKDWDKIRENVTDIMESYPNISLMERTAVVTLLKDGERITGAILLNHDNDFIMINCKAVVLATGGFGNIYKHNLNPNDVDGSGHILALEAGANLVNMEFIQFIPGFTSPKYKTLWGEHTLNYCRDFVDAEGKSILKEVLPEGMTKEELFEIRSTHGPFTNSLPSKYFDIAMMKEILKTKNEDGFELLYDADIYKNEGDFYTIYLNWLEDRGINLARDKMKIAPFAHASNGGVKIDGHGRTGIPGLYAIGELAGGIEGANRLGGNSTGACMVFGKRAAQDCLEFVKSAERVDINPDEVATHLTRLIQPYSKETQASLTPNEVMDAVREIMWFHGNVIRTEKNLQAALEKIAEIKSSFNMESFITSVKERKSAFKARNFLILSELLLKAMLERRESRGAHYREDYPEEQESYNKRLFVSLEKEDITMYFEKT